MESLAVSCAYRTVSEAAMLVVAFVIPIELLAMESAWIERRNPQKYQIRKDNAYTKSDKVYLEMGEHIDA